LRPNPVSHSIRKLPRDDLVVEHDGQPSESAGQRHEPLGLLAPEDVEGQENVVGDPGVGEHLHLAELLAGDADGAGPHLQLAERGNLVRLDVRTVRDAVPVEVLLHPPDVVLHDVQADRDGRRVQVFDERHALPPV